ncbi:dienelactone hydrolase family protein [Kitasatospora sp. NPDC057904]|uniref:dienelactone hydrolase family protein n=1 Tax=unclassified Kitasatospora TaxID=2633591 RepID=UPI0036DF6170
MSSLHFTSDTASAGVRERDFLLGEVPGVLWSPEAGCRQAPLVLMGHGGGLHKKTLAQADRARHLVRACGYTVVAIDAPGHGERPRTAVDDRARADMIRARQDGEPLGPIVAAYGTHLAELAVPEWRATLDALQRLPEIGPDAPIGYGGGITLGTAIGIPLAAAEPRIRAAIFGGGFIPHEGLLAAARRVTVPVEFLLQWDDAEVPRELALGLFDAFASKEKTLHANPGGHGDVPAFEDPALFLSRHLGTA